MRTALWSIRTLIIGGTLSLILATAAAILLAAFLIGRSAVEEESRPLMVAALDDIIERSQRFLASAEQTAVLTQGLLEVGAVSADDPERMERLLFEILRTHPPITAVYHGTSTGSFVFMSRNSNLAAGGYLAKTISVDKSGRRVEIKRRDADFALLESGVDRTDPFDPRTRPWFGAALSGSDSGWTEPYIYWTSREPGISVARAIDCGPMDHAASAPACVVAVDITLSQLSRFLATLRIGRSGTAFIVTRSNRVVAFSHPDRMIAEERMDGARDLVLRLRQSDELGEPALVAALRSLGPGYSLAPLPGTQQTSFVVGERKYLASFAPFDSHGLPWLVGIYLPETDFFDWFFDQQREHFELGLIVAGFMTALAILLSYLLIRPLERIRLKAVAVSKGQLGAFSPPCSQLAEFHETEVAIAAMAQSLSEHRQAMALALEQSVQAGQAKSEFLSRMSHELRTPLNAIIGFTDLLEMRLAKIGADKELEYLADMRSASEQLLAVLARILQFAGLEDGRLSLDEGRFPLDECVHSACLPLQRLIASKRLVMRLDLQPSIEVEGDLAKLRQAVGQVLSNAIRFSPAESEIVLTARRREDGGAELVIRDFGAGMTEQETKLAMQPFMRAAANPYIAGEGGMGLGLPIARALCELHGGTLTIDSRSGHGTTVTLILPAARVIAPAPLTAAASPLTGA